MLFISCLIIRPVLLMHPYPHSKNETHLLSTFSTFRRSYLSAWCKYPCGCLSRQMSMLVSVPRYRETTRSISHVVAPFVEFSWKYTVTHIMLQVPCTLQLRGRSSGPASVEDDHRCHRGHRKGRGSLSLRMERGAIALARCIRDGTRLALPRDDVTWEICISRMLASSMNADRIC